MKSFYALFLALAVAGCTASPGHALKVQALRDAVPYVTRISYSRSMETVVDAGTIRMVTALPYNRLEAGMAAVYWPEGRPMPICHFVGRRVGTDSWETHGMNQPGDIVYLGVLLTRDNYIGVIL
jgi:hypothetical protein